MSKTSNAASTDLVSMCRSWQEMRSETKSTFFAGHALEGAAYDANLKLAEAALDRQNALFDAILAIEPTTPEAFMALAIVVRNELADDNRNFEGEVGFSNPLHEGLHRVLGYVDRFCSADAVDAQQ